MGTPRRIESSERYCWPQHEFEITRGENIIPDFDELPEPVRRKLRYLIERGAVRVLDGEDDSRDAANDARSLPAIQAVNRIDAAGAASPTVASPAVERPSREGTGLEEIFEIARDLSDFGTALASPIRAAIVIVIARDGALAPSELARLLRKPRQTVSRHALSLERAGVLISEREHGARRYRLAGRSAERVARLLDAS